MTNSPDEPPQDLTAKDRSSIDSLFAQTLLLKQFHDSCDRSLQRVLSLCEWTIRPDDDDAPLLEINCFSYGSWRQILEKNLQITNLLRQVAGATASVTVHCSKPVPQMRHIGYFFNPYREE